MTARIFPAASTRRMNLRRSRPAMPAASGPTESTGSDLCSTAERAMSRAAHAPPALQPSPVEARHDIRGQMHQQNAGAAQEGAACGGEISDALIAREDSGTQARRQSAFQ